MQLMLMCDSAMDYLVYNVKPCTLVLYSCNHLHACRHSVLTAEVAHNGSHCQSATAHGCRDTRHNDYKPSMPFWTAACQVRPKPKT